MTFKRENYFLKEKKKKYNEPMWVCKRIFGCIAHFSASFNVIYININFDYKKKSSFHSDRREKSNSSSDFNFIVKNLC